MGPPPTVAGSAVQQRDGHLLMLFDDEEQRCAGLAAWVREGLVRGEQVALGDAAGPAGESVEEVLASHGVAVGSVVHDGSLRLLPLETFYSVGGQARLLKEALAAGFTGYRVAAQAATALSLMPPEDYADFEQALENLTRTRPVAAMCQYDRGRTTGPRLDQAMSAHPHALDEGQLSVRCAPGWLKLEGEVDRDNADVLNAVVRMARPATPGNTVHVDLRGLSFLDVAGLRAMVTASLPLRAAGIVVLLLAPQPGIAMMLSILGIERLPGMQVVGSLS